MKEQYDVVFMWELRVSYVLISVFLFFFCERLVGQRSKIEGAGQFVSVTTIVSCNGVDIWKISTTAPKM